MPLKLASDAAVGPRVLAALRAHAEVTREFAAPPLVPTRDAREFTALDFLRDFVGPSRPVLLSHATDAWPAHARWLSAAALAARAPEAAVTLSLTPTGLADAPARGRGGDGGLHFAKPLDVTLPLADALARVARRDGAGGCGTAYLSAQNDCLRAQTPGLARDVGRVTTAGDALAAGDAARSNGGGPAAINVWAGTSEARTWLHADPYDNLYTVIRGQKRFILLPPTDAMLLRRRALPHAAWRHDDDKCSRGGLLGGRSDRGSDEHIAVDGVPPCWELVPDSETPPVPWYIDDVAAPRTAARPPLSASVVDVRPGETLFLPAFWLHDVSQGTDGSDDGRQEGDDSNGDGDGVTIAVNSWFDAPMLGASGYSAAQLAIALGAAVAGEGRGGAAS